jgi:internalin A
MFDWKEMERRSALNAEETQSEVAALIAREQVDRRAFLEIYGYNIGVLPSAIAAMLWLTLLDCRYSRVRDLSPIVGLTALTTLECDESQVSDLGPISGLTALNWLNCRFTQVSDLSPISGLTALNWLNCSLTSVSALSPLVGLTELSWLDCSNTRVSDLSALVGLTVLDSLFCSNTRVRDLSPLVGFTALTELNCSNTQVSDLEPLLRVPMLRDLHAQQLPNCPIPPEFLSDADGLTEYDNCLPRIRSYYANLDAGAEPFRQHKIFLLGNGTVGKTQVARRLMGDDYDANVKSTHGIQLHAHKLPASPDDRDAAAGDSFDARIWDFGGQDIYHGTHALFLKTRAIFLICWEGESEDKPHHIIDDVEYRNRPLNYWLDYVRQFAGPNAQVVLVQTQIDKPNAPRTPPVDLGQYADLTFLEPCRTSAKDNRGFADLKEKIAEAVAQIEKPALQRIGTCEKRVMASIDAARAAGDRTLSVARFEDICQAADVRGAPEHTLHFLHHSGEVFHSGGLFGDQIIIDQRWALDAIYAVFNREECCAAIQAERGRFTMAMLAATVWRDFAEADRKHFLSMMVNCGMAFRYMEESEGTKQAVYIASDLLPERDAASVTRWIDRLWDDDAPTQTVTLRFPLLHDGLMRALMTGIGKDAGLHAVYWKNGLLFFDAATKACAMITADWPDKYGWAGEIIISTQRSGAAALLDVMDRHVREVVRKIGLKLAVPNTPNRDTITDDFDRTRGNFSAREEHGETKAAFTPGAAAPIRPVCYVSYAWGDGSAQADANEAMVDDLCVAAAARGIEIVRDKTHLAGGASISAFTEEIAQAERVVTLIGGRYWKRPDCFMELYGCWIDAKQRPELFRAKIREFLFADGGLYDANIVRDIADHWEAEFTRCDQMRGAHRGRHDALIADHADSWVPQCRRIIATLQDKVRAYENDFERFKQELFAELESLKYHAPDV